MVYNIYTLTCPVDGIVKYIGITRNSDFTQRLNAHWSSREGTYEKLIWIEQCRVLKLKPIMEVLESIETDNICEAYNLEKHWIEQFKQWGFNLVNGKHFQENRRRYKSPAEYKEIAAQRLNHYEQTINKIHAVK